MKRKWDCLKRCKTESKKIVLNKCIGGFGLSDVACQALMHRLGYTTYDTRMAREVVDNIERDNPALLAVVEEFGKKAWVACGDNEWIHRPMIVEISDPDIPYTIVWMDGMEIAVPTDFERIMGPF